MSNYVAEVISKHHLDIGNAIPRKLYKAFKCTYKDCYTLHGSKEGKNVYYKNFYDWHSIYLKVMLDIKVIRRLYSNE